MQSNCHYDYDIKLVIDYIKIDADVKINYHLKLETNLSVNQKKSHSNFF